MVRKTLTINGRGIDDMGNLLKVARSVGREALKCEKVRVCPDFLKMDPGGNFIIQVEPLETDKESAGAAGDARDEGEAASLDPSGTAGAAYHVDGSKLEHRSAGAVEPGEKTGES